MVPAAIFDFLMRNKYRLDEDIVYNNHRPVHILWRKRQMEIAI